MKKFLLIAVLLVPALVCSAQKNTSTSFIDKFKDDAIAIMHQTGVPASIILAVAMHESANGNSSVARNLNNDFGIKGDKKVVYYRHHKKIRSPYKQYDSVEQSFEDFARIVTSKKQFCSLVDKYSHYDYAGWAHGIQKGGYAGSRKWAVQVLAIIKKYGLGSLDERPGDDNIQLAENSK